jgi:rhodanese-related sulfurtransferase
MKVFKDLGFTEVYNMAGGINQWISEGRPTAQDDEE